MRICRHYTFEFEFKNNARLPKWKGTLIRGSVGYHLRKLSCSNDNACNNCKHIFNCPYGYLFRTKSKGIVLRKIEGFTKPYVIKPPIDGKKNYNPDETFTFSIVLFGDAVKFENNLIEAIKELCKAGLGVRKFRSPLKLKRILIENPFTGRSEVLFENETFYDSNLFIRESNLNIELGELFLITFLTPFRLIKKGTVVTNPQFRDLIVSILRRYSAIRYQYLEKDLDMDVESVLRRSENVELVFSNLNERFFTYKREKMAFLYGELAFKGRLNSDLKKLLAFGTLVHIGKMASFGFGWFKVV